MVKGKCRSQQRLVGQFSAVSASQTLGLVTFVCLLFSFAISWTRVPKGLKMKAPKGIRRTGTIPGN